MQKVKLVQGFSYLAEWEYKVQVCNGGPSRPRILLAFAWINISQDHYPGFIDWNVEMLWNGVQQEEENEVDLNLPGRKGLEDWWEKRG